MNSLQRRLTCSTVAFLHASCPLCLHAFPQVLDGRNTAVQSDTDSKPAPPGLPGRRRSRRAWRRPTAGRACGRPPRPPPPPPPPPPRPAGCAAWPPGPWPAWPLQNGGCENHEEQQVNSTSRQQEQAVTAAQSSCASLLSDCQQRKAKHRPSCTHVGRTASPPQFHRLCPRTRRRCCLLHRCCRRPGPAPVVRVEQNE